MRTTELWEVRCARCETDIVVTSRVFICYNCANTTGRVYVDRFERPDASGNIPIPPDDTITAREEAA